LNNKEIVDLVTKVNNNSHINKENQKTIEEIISACEYATKRDAEFAQKIQGCVKHFYKKELKTDVGNIDSSYLIQISKRGIGSKYHYSKNMDLFTAFLSTPKSWNNERENKQSFQYLIDNTLLRKGLDVKITDEGIEFFNKIKEIKNKYKLINVAGSMFKSADVPNELKSYTEERTGFLEINYNQNEIKISIVNKTVKGEYYNRGKKIFESRERDEDLEIKILQTYFKEDINELLNTTHKEIMPYLKEWKGFEEEFNQLIAKYAILSAL